MQIYRATISKEEISGMPQLGCEGKKILVVDNLESAYKECKILMKREILGFDTETRPSFRKGETHKVSLLQLADEQCCWLFRLNKIDFPGVLADLITAERPVKIGLSVKDDYRRMAQRAPITPHGFVDLQQEVKKIGIAELGLQKIYAIMFGKRISKTSRLSNWDADILQPKQMEYAAIDAWACLDIYKKLCDELQKNIS